jgi:hypothetical protein
VTNPRDLDEEREFQDFLRRKRSPFPRDPAADEPPAELDLRVLGQAKQAIESDSGTVGPRAISWLVPFATAATVVIAFAMFRDVGEQVPNTSASRGVAATASSPDTASAPPTLESLQDTAATAAPQVADGAAAESIVRAPESPAVARAPAPTPAVTSPPPPVSEPVAPLVAQGVPSSSIAESAQADAGAPTRAERETALAGAADRPEEIVVTGNSATAARQSADKASDYSAGGTVASSRAAGPPSVSAAAAERVRDPDVWWAAIELLRASGKTAEADRELVEFRRLYPNYQSPRPPPPATEATPSPAP